MVGIGFFAPLPLALMMPFMAGQSMLMGDAFGKAYQYGKRKISAMSNEEFNKLTPEQLGKEIVSDYSAMIPSLSVAIKQSTAFQSLIIQELANIIRSLPKDIVSGFTGESANPLSTIHHEATSTPDNIDYGKIAIATLKIMLGPIASNFNIPGFGEAEATDGNQFIGPPEKIPDTLTQHIDIQKDLLSDTPTYTSPPAKAELSAEVLANAKQLREDTEWREWSSKLAKLRSRYLTTLTAIKHTQENIRLKKGNPTALGNLLARQNGLRRSTYSLIRQMSNDYRHPNNNIRENALRLRQAMAAGKL